VTFEDSLPSERSASISTARSPLNSTPKEIKERFRKTIWQIVVKLKRLKLDFDEVKKTMILWFFL